MSDGKKSFVVLKLLLDFSDKYCPILIDQPEENLDPRSVFTELVKLFREARRRRQVIIVTHNANLVVNTDADQVVVAKCTKHSDGRPPEFEYVAGALENDEIRAHVCEILEGGEAAFRERARRLRLTL